jgi:hypothetical protein
VTKEEKLDNDSMDEVLLETKQTEFKTQDESGTTKGRSNISIKGK